MALFHTLICPLLDAYRKAKKSAIQTSQFKIKAKVTRLNEIPIARISEEYLSFSIDISVLAGGYWWEGSQNIRKGLGTRRISPLNLNEEKLDKLVKALSPSYLRIGGSEADKIHYFEAPKDEPDSLVLTREIWDSLHHFVQRNELKFAFTFKYGLFRRKDHGAWQGSELEKLLDYSQTKGYRIDVCELGNELNGYWAFHGLSSQPRAKNLAIDYETFASHVKCFLPDAKIIGPGSAFWPKLGETITPFSNLTRKFLDHCQQQNTSIDIVDWHYYPFQSDRSPVRTRSAKLNTLLKPQSLNDFKKYARQIRQMRDQYYPQAQLWTGETGSAQCGGQERFSERFASCFWWADQLGQGALTGQSVMIRQSLIGGEYGLIDRLTLKPRPDYWLSWLWQQLMGTDVYKVESSYHLLRCYCHNTPGSKPPKNSSPGKSGLTLLLINLSGKSVKIRETGFTEPVKQYCLSAKSLSSKNLYINGKKAKYRGGDFAISDYDVENISTKVPGYSINFWIYH